MIETSDVSLNNAMKELTIEGIDIRNACGKIINMFAANSPCLVPWMLLFVLYLCSLQPSPDSFSSISRLK